MQKMADSTVWAPAVVEPGSAVRRWPGATRSPHVYGVGGLVAVVAVVYSVLSVTLYYTYQDGIYDLGIFDQAVRSFAQFRPGISIAKGMHNFGNPNFSVLGDHFSPIDALLAPLYWIYDSPVDLLVAQAVLFALAVPPIWVFTRRAFGGGRKGTMAAYFVAVAYGVSWPITAAVGFNFHEVAFAPLLTALALERLQKGRLGTALVMLAGLVLVKEDMGLYVAGLGLGLALTRNLGIPRQRLAGLLIAVAGVIFSLVAIYVFIPAMGGQSGYYWAYGELGPNASTAVRHVLEHPLSSASNLFTPRVKLHTMVELFAPFLFLSILSPLVIPVIPFLLERMLGVRYPAWWSSQYQYNAYLIVPIALGSVDGALRAERWLTWLGRRWRSLRVLGRLDGRLALGATGVFAVIALALVPHFGIGKMFHSSFYKRTPAESAEAAAVSHVPSGVLVEAVGSLGVHLDARDTVELWGDGSPEFPQWAVASVSASQLGFHDVADQVARVEALRAHGYVTVFSRDGYLVMHAPGALRDAAPRIRAARGGSG
jgi:uncharacterized membrane protein